MKLRISRKVLIPIVLFSLPVLIIQPIFFIFLITFFVIFIEVYRVYKYLEIEGEEIKEKKGIFKIEIKRTNFQKVSSIKRVQGPIARFFKYGDIIIKTLEGEVFEAKYVSNPENIEEELKERLKL